MPKKLKYLLIASHVPSGGTGGGMVRYATELATALARSPRVELHVVSAAASEEFFEEIVPKSRIWALQGVGVTARSIAEYSGLFGFPSLAQFDVVHGTKHLVPSRLGRRGRMPIRVLTAHDMLLFDRPSDYPYRKRLLLAESYRRSLDTSDLIIADSNATADRVKAYNARHGNKIVTIPLAVASSLLNATPSPVRALKSRPFALVVGDASPRKNLSTLVDSWPHVVAQVPDAVLTIVGPPGWGTNYFGRRFNEMVAEGHVLTLGHVSDAELRWLYQTCVVTLCPSRLEGFGLPAAEASAFGAPIIRSNDSALREASDNRGIELSPNDADGWTQEIVNAFNHGRREIPHQTPRLWPEVCEETIDAVSSVLGPRYKGDANSPAT